MATKARSDVNGGKRAKVGWMVFFRVLAGVFMSRLQHKPTMKDENALCVCLKDDEHFLPCCTKAAEAKTKIEE
ncbi:MULTISPECIES: hypothetical protein [unclassified Rhizobium]|uniref:hypothetical protein n=1 Tax=unclassified Rhizobium TaxID=2613769 RepID=UPI000A7F3324|nr:MULTISPECIES: hypothetical protein [unclassified Rhizobium]